MVDISKRIVLVPRLVPTFKSVAVSLASLTGDKDKESQGINLLCDSSTCLCLDDLLPGAHPAHVVFPLRSVSLLVCPVASAGLLCFVVSEQVPAAKMSVLVSAAHLSRPTRSFFS